MRLERVSHHNADMIYQFELENRLYFEQTLPSRGDQYYDRSHFDQMINELCQEETNQRYMYIIKNNNGDMVGRINLFAFPHENYLRAFELGYRIGEVHKNKGYASQAVRDVLTKGFYQHHIEYIRAATAPKNIASQIVLLRNGLSYVKKIERDIEVNGIYEDSLVYARVR